MEARSLSEPLKGVNDMPGMGLSFSCQCGFESGEVLVGGTPSGYYDVALCLGCARIFSVWRKGACAPAPTCRECHELTMLITDPGGWGPRPLQDQFPHATPWMLDDGALFEEGPTDEEAAMMQELRVLCPKCKKLAAAYSIVTMWD